MGHNTRQRAATTTVSLDPEPGRCESAVDAARVPPHGGAVWLTSTIAPRWVVVPANRPHSLSGRSRRPVPLDRPRWSRAARQGPVVIVLDPPVLALADHGTSYGLNSNPLLNDLDAGNGAGRLPQRCRIRNATTKNTKDARSRSHAFMSSVLLDFCDLVSQRSVHLSSNASALERCSWCGASAFASEPN